MTQGALFPQLRKYTVDTCCFMGLDGVHKVLTGQAPRILYTATEQTVIWKGLEQLANEGRLRIVRQVLEELERHHPDGLKRVQALPKYKAPPVNNDLRARYQRIIDEFPDLLDEDSPYDQADGWLVAVAQQYGFVVVTDELDKATRTTDKTRDHIPDACQSPSVNVLCRTLRQIAEIEEGWLSTTGSASTGGAPDQS